MDVTTDVAYTATSPSHHEGLTPRFEITRSQVRKQLPSSSIPIIVVSVVSASGVLITLP